MIHSKNAYGSPFAFLPLQVKNDLWEYRHALVVALTLLSPSELFYFKFYVVILILSATSQET